MKIKICGLFSDRDIDYVNEAQPDFIGFVFAQGSRRRVSEEQASFLRRRLRPDITPVGVFVNEPLPNVIRLLEKDIIQIAQFHGDETEDYINELKARTHKPVIKAVRVTARGDIEVAQHSAADYLLLDNGPGGTGTCFDWSFVGKVSKVSKPFFLAGGLNAANMESAIAVTHPYAVDVSSGVETAGKKDRDKILEIVRRIRYV